MLKRTAVRARRRWPMLLLSVVSITALTLSAFALLANAGLRHSSAASWSNVKISKFDATDTFISSAACAPQGGWADMPGVSKTFKLGGTAARPVLVSYSGALVVDTRNSSGQLRVLVDGAQVGLGAYGENNPDDFDAIGRVTTFTVLTPALSPGNHTVVIQWGMALGWGTALCGNGPSTLTILHS
jgi:hypothetical protein